MEQQIDCKNVAPQELNGLLDLERFEMCCRFDECVADTGLETRLVDLVKARAAQINGCAACIERYAHEAREAGETEDRLYVLGAWRRATCFTPRERAALGWSEAITLVVGQYVPVWIYEESRRYFEDAQLTVLAVAAAGISGRYRPDACYRAAPGTTGRCSALVGDSAGSRS